MKTLVQTVWASVVDEQVGRVAWFGHLAVVKNREKGFYHRKKEIEIIEKKKSIGE